MSPSPPSHPRVDSRLDYALRPVKRAVTALRIHRYSTLVWLTVAALAGLLLALGALQPGWRFWGAPVLLAVFVVAALLAAWRAWRVETTTQAAVAAVEEDHPELGSSLRTAVEQVPRLGGHLEFLQRRVVDEALRHGDAADWAAGPRRRARRYLAAHLVTLAAALALGLLVVKRHTPRSPGQAPVFAGIEVTPGNVEIERGTSVVIAGRFGPGLPREVVLVWSPTDGPAQRRPMDRSLADPVFALTLPRVQSSGAYHLEHDGVRTESYRLQVYERPELVRSDARLEYPDYTGREPRTWRDTRRISAVVGSRLTYDLSFNVPLEAAILRDQDGSELALEPSDEHRTTYRLETVLQESREWTLHLTDAAGRTNARRTLLHLDVTENRRPQLSLTFPQDDSRVSPLEELSLQAEARDDFGLSDYGLAFAIDNETPRYISTAPDPSLPAAVGAQLAHRVRLEEHSLHPDQLVTWFAWADDFGPDGTIRRTHSDLRFAEVRSLDEIFRESETGAAGGAAGGGQGDSDELLDIQRQISIATWKLLSADVEPDEFASTTGTLAESQQQALLRLTEMRSQLRDARSTQAAEAAAQFMQTAATGLESAHDRNSEEPLHDAWAAAQGAYQALLRLQPRESAIARANNTGGGSGRSRNQGQLDQLDFRRAEDRYATESQAQPPPTPEEREQLQVLSQLRELARRQQDLNERLQELQTALLAAEDEERREEIRRELKRLEDEQRSMLADLDETRQRVDQMQPGQRRQQTRQQLEETREAMERAGEQLSAGEVSQALAAGSRAREGLQETSEELRQQSASRFGDAMREARRQARELAEEQRDAVETLERMNEGHQALDDTAERQRLARRLEAQAERRDQLLEALQEVTEESEPAEPSLHRQLYDLLREQRASAAADHLQSGAELLRRGFVEPIVSPQQGVAQAFDQLQRAVERAADTVLGDETQELQFAQRELDDLRRALETERPGTETDGASGGGESETSDAPPGDERAEPADDPDATALAALGRELTGDGGTAGDGPAGERPLSGSSFGDWNDRLRTIEHLLDDPEQRQRVAQARFTAEDLRRAHVHDAQPPQWELVELGIVRPLQETSAWLQRELARRENPDVLQPVDRDPVPERYAEAVQKYYESLSAGAGPSP